MLSRYIAVAILALAVFPAGNASAAPLVFDFESGLQGWTSDTVDRISGAPLGGDFAIFDEGGGAMWLELDLTGYSFLSFSRFQVSPSNPVINFVYVIIRPVSDPGSNNFFDAGTSLLATPENPAPNPDLRMVDLSPFVGLHRVTFSWTPPTLSPYSGFVDDVVFYPIPEPSSALLLIGGLVLLATRTRRRRAG